MDIQIDQPVDSDRPSHAYCSRSRCLRYPIHNHVEALRHDPDQRSYYTFDLRPPRLSKAASAKAVETTFEIIKKTFENSEDVLISGFGKFCVKEKGKRTGGNPVTGEDLMLDDRRVVIFRCSEVLKAILNGGQV
jgi:integration host factor subunit alpha